ncbi:endospore germination permease [Cohnella lubricantis]|uniref:Endospore germination permease n=1 Tax=Cohnella lubricantis TaxID=2163172 RepID=A0A841TJF4_9BACL|nr:endospore germination permease [Cohnella lubricantis]MBB6678631.1 endospore germination permease [Cohnella lubricantis]MBP2119209.1 spore germination protein KB [Cohnella lubricantis]
MRSGLTVAECMAAIIMIIMPTAYLIVPTAVLDFAAQDAWISTIAATAIGGGIAAWLGWFAGRNGDGESFLNWLSGRSGRAIAFAGGLLLAFHFFSHASRALNEYISFLKVNVLPTTPNAVLIAVTVLLAMYAVGQGIVTIARICFLMMIATVGIYTATIVLLYSRMHFSYLQPIGEKSIGHIAAGAFTPVCWMSEAAIILLIAPFMAKPRQAPRAVIWGVLLVGFMMMFIVLEALMLFGPNVVKFLQYPSFELISVIQFGGFLERIDMYFIMFWMVTVFLKISLLLFGAVHCLEQTFRVRGGRQLILWAIGLLLTLDASFSWPENFEMEIEAFAKNVSLIIFNILVPFVLWLASYLKLGRGSKKAEEGRT